MLRVRSILGGSRNGLSAGDGQMPTEIQDEEWISQDYSNQSVGVSSPVVSRLISEETKETGIEIQSLVTNALLNQINIKEPTLSNLKGPERVSGVLRTLGIEGWCT